MCLLCVCSSCIQSMYRICYCSCVCVCVFIKRVNSSIDHHSCILHLMLQWTLPTAQHLHANKCCTNMNWAFNTHIHEAHKLWFNDRIHLFVYFFYELHTSIDANLCHCFNFDDFDYHRNEVLFHFAQFGMQNHIRDRGAKAEHKKTNKEMDYASQVCWRWFFKQFSSYGNGERCLECQ